MSNDKEHNIKQLFDSTLGCFLITDEKGDVLYMNKAMEQKTGFDEAEVYGKAPGKFWGAQMYADFYKKMWDELSATRQYSSNVLNKRKDEELFKDYLNIVTIGGEEKQKYFLQMEPHLSSEKYQNIFVEEFRDFTRHDFDVQEFFSWVMPWMMQDYTPIECKDAFTSLAEATGDMNDFLEEHFIVPTEKKYSARLEDKKLILEAKANPEQFFSLYEKYHDRVHSYFYFRTGQNSQVAEELTQETFYKALRYLESFEPKNASYLTYLMRIAHNLLVNFYRKKEELPIETFENTFLVGTKDEYERFWMTEIIWKFAKTLSDTEYTCLKMMYKKGFSIKEIAAILGKTENAVKLIVSRARKKIKKMMGN